MFAVTWFQFFVYLFAVVGAAITFGLLVLGMALCIMVVMCDKGVGDGGLSQVRVYGSADLEKQEGQSGR